MKDNLQVALLQLQWQNNKAAQIESIEQSIVQAAQSGAQLIILPELHDHVYFCQSEDTANYALAERIPGPSTNRLGALAKQYQVVIVASLFEKRAVGLYHNTAVVLETDGSIAGMYRKMHIPDDPQYYEKFYFTPGDLGFYPIQTSVGSLGVLVCWDQWFPEAARLMALRGADVLIYPTAIGGISQDERERLCDKQYEAWRLVQRGHAIANGLPVVTVNRCGFEADPSNMTQGITFWGNSFIADPQGELLVDADNTPGIYQAVLSYQKILDVRHGWPFLRDRRVDAYQGLTQLYCDKEIDGKLAHQDVLELEA